MERKLPRYVVYTKRRGCQRATRDGIYTDDLERAKDMANRDKNSWWGQNGVYEWVKVKDTETGKYIYTA